MECVTRYIRQWSPCRSCFINPHVMWEERTQSRHQIGQYSESARLWINIFWRLETPNTCGRGFWPTPTRLSEWSVRSEQQACNISNFLTVGCLIKWRTLQLIVHGGLFPFTPLSLMQTLSLYSSIEYQGSVHFCPSRLAAAPAAHLSHTAQTLTVKAT